MIPTWSASMPRIQLIQSEGWSNMSPVGAILVPSPPKTGANLLHPRPPPPPPIVKRVLQEYRSPQVEVAVHNEKAVNRPSGRGRHSAGEIAVQKLERPGRPPRRGPRNTPYESPSPPRIRSKVRAFPSAVFPSVSQARASCPHARDRGWRVDR